MKNSSSMMTWSNPLCVVIMLLLGLIIVLAIFRPASPFLNLGFGINAHIGDFKGSFEIEAFDNNLTGNPVLVMYYADWCGHCKNAKPHFTKLIEEYKGKVKCMMINAESADPEIAKLVKSQDIKGFPTIRYYPTGLGGEFKEYEGGREYTDFVQYLGPIEGVLAKSPDNAAPVNGSN